MIEEGLKGKERGLNKIWVLMTIIGGKKAVLDRKGRFRPGKCRWAQ